MMFEHKSVLLGETIESLRIRPDGVYVDGTLGGGGHAFEVLKRLSDKGRLIGMDQDADAIAAASKRLSPFGGRAVIVRSNYEQMGGVLSDLGIREADGICLDLGVSSYQLDTPLRGFSYREDAPLDMRMDQSAPLTAQDVVNGWSQEELKRILRQYGEERYSGLIAAAIVRERGQAPIETTGQLAEIIRDAMPAKARKEKQHPAKRSFQAIRIAVNDELGEVERLLDGVLDVLNPGGRIAIISFHSLEDRLVKTAYAGWAKGCTCPPDFPVCVCGKTPKVRLVGKRPIVADGEELDDNPRARSAKLRVAEKL